MISVAPPAVAIAAGRFLAAAALALALAACQSDADRAASAMATAQQLASAGQFGPAQAQFDIAVAARDDLPELWMMRARNQVALGDYAGAYASFRNALDQDRTNREALDALAQLSLASNRLDDARDYANQILALAPGDPNGMLVDASVAFRTGRYDSAAETVAALLKQSPGNERALVLASRLEQRRGHFERAIALLEPIFRESGGNDETRAQLVDLYARRADGRGLLAVAQRDAADRPTDPLVQRALAGRAFVAGRTGDGLAALDATHKLAAGDAPRLATIRQLAENDIEPAAVRQAMGDPAAHAPDLVLAIAEYALVRGDWTTADALLAQLPDADDDSGPDRLGARAYVAAQTGRIAAARSFADAALARDGGQPFALMARALIALTGRDGNGALRDARQVVSENAQFATGYAILSRVLAARGDRLLAEKAYFDAVNADPDDPVAVRQLAGLLVGKNRLDDAITYVRRYNGRNPASTGGWTLRQQLCRRTRDAACLARTASLIARLKGQDVPFPAVPADEKVGVRDYRDDESGD